MVVEDSSKESGSRTVLEHCWNTTHSMCPLEEASTHRHPLRAHRQRSDSHSRSSVLLKRFKEKEIREAAEPQADSSLVQEMLK